MEGSPDVFFHNSACNGMYDSLNVGQMVSFDLESGDKGPKAANVVGITDQTDLFHTMALALRIE